MNPLQSTRGKTLSGNCLLWLREGEDTSVRDIAALHQSDPLQLWKRSQLRNGVVGQVLAAGQVDVSDSVAQLDQLHHTCIGDARAVT